MEEQQQRSASSKSGSAESLREKLVLTLAGFVLTVILGGVLTTWIQQRGWAWQNRVATVEKDINNVVSTYKATSELLNMRWHAVYRVVRAFEREETAPALNNARTDYDAADREWALHYPNIARDVEFYVDSPFGIEGSADLTKVWTYMCTGGTARAMVETQSARVILELVNHCQDKLKSILEPLIDPAAEAPRVDAKQRKTIIDQSYRNLDQLYRTNDVLRCVIFDRAISIRASSAALSYWNAFLGIEAPIYQAGKKIEQCS
jgi:hypothetical protein